MTSPSSLDTSGRDAGDHRHLRHRRGSRRAPPVAVPDVAAAAAEAVVRYLHNSSVATEERDLLPDGAAAAAGTGTATGTGTGTGTGTAAEGPHGDAGPLSAAVDQAMPWRVAWPDASQFSAESVAVNAAAVSVATLDRIEAMAAKLEADIAAAHRAQAKLQAGAGAAARAAVRAAQEAAEAALSAIEADKRAKISLIKVARYVEVTIVLLVIAMVILVVTATSVH
jgi:hypothetical protein